MKDLVVFNGNDGQAAQAKQFIESLRDPKRGSFKGDIVIISTQLSPKVRSWYEAMGVIVFERRIVEVLDRWASWLDIAAFEHARLSVNQKVRYGKNQEKLLYKLVKNDRIERCALLKKIFKVYAWFNPRWKQRLREEFDIWHRKHLSKLNLIPLLESNRASWSRVLVCDVDMVFQRPVALLFDQVQVGKVLIAEEIEPMIPKEEGGSPVYGSNVIVREKYPEWSECVELGEGARREVNVGVFLGARDTVLDTAKEWRSLMLSSGYESLFFCHIYDFFHEQDFFRLLRDKYKDKFIDVGLNYIYHGCNAGIRDIEYKEGIFSRVSNNETPVIMHFAGGVWKQFEHINAEYLKPVDAIIEN